MGKLRALNVAAPVIGVLLAGCGDRGDAPELGDVSGYVRLDGQPLSAARVIFQPEGGRPSIGLTDDEGYYELSYSRGETGAKVGRHVVRISTFVEADDEQPGVPEQVPDRFDERSELVREIASGGNEIDFELTSK